MSKALPYPCFMCLKVRTVEFINHQDQPRFKADTDNYVWHFQPLLMNLVCLFVPLWDSRYNFYLGQYGPLDIRYLLSEGSQMRALWRHRAGTKISNHYRNPSQTKEKPTCLPMKCVCPVLAVNWGEISSLRIHNHKLSSEGSGVKIYTLCLAWKTPNQFLCW